MTIRYYIEDISVVPYRLLVHAISPMLPKPLAMVLAAVIRLGGKVGIRLPATHGVGFVDTETEIDPCQLPASAIARWAPILEQLRDLGFRPLRCESIATVGSKQQCSTILLDEPGTTIAILEWTRMPTAKGIEENTPLEFDSFGDGCADIVTGVVRKIDIPMAQLTEIFNIASVEMISLENNRPLAESYREHQQRCTGKKILRLTQDNALLVTRQHTRERFQSLLNAGFLRELRPREISKLREIGQERK